MEAFTRVSPSREEVMQGRQTGGKGRGGERFSFLKERRRHAVGGIPAERTRTTDKEALNPGQRLMRGMKEVDLASFNKKGASRGQAFLNDRKKIADNP